MYSTGYFYKSFSPRKSFGGAQTLKDIFTAASPRDLRDRQDQTCCKNTPPEIRDMCKGFLSRDASGVKEKHGREDKPEVCPPFVWGKWGSSGCRARHAKKGIVIRGKLSSHGRERIGCLGQRSTHLNRQGDVGKQSREMTQDLTPAVCNVSSLAGEVETIK